MYQALCFSTQSELSKLSLPHSAITWERLRAETKKDVVLTKIMEQVARGFPDSARKVHPAVRPYHRYREQLSILDDVLCYKTRVVVPTTLRQNVLTTLHSAHQGTVGMTSRAAEAVFWHDM